MGGITNPAEEYFKDGGWGWDGTRWRKDNLTWGYNGTLANRQSTLAAAAGTNTLNHSIVPAGEVWVIVTHGMVNANTAVPGTLYAVISGVGYTVKAYGTMVAGIWSTGVPLGIVLAAGDYMSAMFESCVLNDDLYSDITGYKMKVA